MHGVVWWFVGLCALWAAGCGDKQDPFLVDDGGQDGVGPVTYTGRIKALLDASCIRCHATSRQGADRTGAPVGVDFDTYVEAKNSGPGANQRIQAGTMPPSGPLPSGEKAQFQAWIDQNMPE